MRNKSNLRAVFFYGRKKGKKNRGQELEKGKETVVDDYK